MTEEDKAALAETLTRDLMHAITIATGTEPGYMTDGKDVLVAVMRKILQICKQTDPPTA